MSKIIDTIYISALLSDVPIEVQRAADLTQLQEELTMEDQALMLSIVSLAKTFVMGQSGDAANSNSYLEPIFRKVLTKNLSENKFGYSPEVLSIKTANFPKKSNEVTGNATSLWRDLARDIRGLSIQKLSFYGDTILYLLEKYTTYLPNSSGQRADVSFYDYTKNVAGLSVCLYQYCKVNNIEPNELTAEDEPILILGADISGIQDYLFDIISKHAAKNLKGRSFYIQLLVNSILVKCLSQLKLYEGNIIYAPGDSFYLTLPNTKDIKDKVKQLENKISDKMFLQFKSALSMNIATIEVNVAALETDISAIFSALGDKLQNKKKQKDSLALKNHFDEIFKPFENGGEDLRDAITGDEITPKELDNNENYLGNPKLKAHVFEIGENRLPKSLKQRPNKVTGQEGREFIRRLTYEQIAIGTYLKNFKYWIVSEEELGIHLKESEKDFIINPINLGIHNYLITDYKEGILKLKGKAVRIYKINDVENFLPQKLGYQNLYGFKFYGGNNYPTIGTEGMPKDFSEMAGMKGDNENAGDGGFKRLGVLKMDVDFLGGVFQKGLPSLSQYSTLSRSLNYFFAGYLNTIWQENETYNQVTQILYSGGDDLFFVGRWNSIIDFAETIKADFEKWVVNHNISISGGISIVPHKFPIMLAAEYATGAEKMAKLYELKVADETLAKNAFCFVDMPLNWDREFPKVKQLKDTLVYFFKEKKINKSILNKIRSYHNSRLLIEEHNEKATSDNQINPRWIWTMVYDLSQFGRRTGDKEAKDFIQKLRQSIFTNSYEGQKLDSSYHFLTLLNAASKWAELELRTLDENN